MSGILSMLSGGTYSSAPVNTVAPVVSGTATVGQTLSSTTGTWTGAPDPTFGYQWQRAGSNIGGATSSTYTLVNADAGSAIRCVVTATNVVSAVSANSNATSAVAAIAPGAPTIGTATQTGSSTATVVFTQPVSNGGSTITSYTATSSPSGITGTLSQAGSGTITVSGLDALTAYTFTVTATNSAGTSSASGSSNSITTASPTIGAAFGGGYYAGQIGVSGTATHYLVVGPVASAQSNKLWKTSGTSTSGTSSVIDGPTNSANMNDASHPAAQFCEAVSTGGYSDWYMPAKNELEICYFNLKPSTDANAVAGDGGTNANAVPARTTVYWVSGLPAQTTATIFRTGNAEAFAISGGLPNAGTYWNSTEYNATRGRYQTFKSGIQNYYRKAYASNFVRAVRRVAV